MSLSVLMRDISLARRAGLRHYKGVNRNITPMPAVLDPHLATTLPPSATEEAAAEIFAKYYYTPTVVMNAIALEALLKECERE